MLGAIISSTTRIHFILICQTYNVQPPYIICLLIIMLKCTFFCIKIFLHYLLRILSRMWNHGGKDRNVSKFLAKLLSNKLK